MKYSILISTTLLVIGLSSCQKDEVNNILTYYTDPDAVILATPTIGKVNSRTNTEGNGDVWQVGDEFVAKDRNPNALPGKDHITMRYNGTSFVPVDDNYIIWVKDGISLNVYSPAESAPTSFTLPEDQSSIAKLRASDWMGAQTFAGRVDPLTLTLFHNLVKLEITINGANDQYSTSATISNPVISLANWTPSAILNVTIPASKSIKAYLSAKNANGFTIADKPVIIALIPSGTYAANSRILSLDVNGETLNVNIPNELKLTPSSNLKFNLVVGKNSVKIDDVIVDPWEDGTFTTPEGTTSGVINVTSPGTLTSQEIINSITDGKIIITGSPNQDDIDKIAIALNNFPEVIKSIDLSGCNLSELGDKSLTPTNMESFIKIELTNLDLPKNLIKVGNMAPGIKINDPTFVLPSTLEEVGNYSLRNLRNLDKLIIPASIKKIGNYSFDGCYETTQIIFLGAVPPSMGQSFPRYNGNLTIYVPKGSKNAYIAAFAINNESTYTDKIQEMP